MKARLNLSDTVLKIFDVLIGDALFVRSVYYPGFLEKEIVT